MASLKKSQIPFSVEPPIDLEYLLSTLSSWLKTPSLLLTGTISSLSPKIPISPSSELIQVIMEERLSILATTTEPYSEVKVPQAEPLLSERQMVFPFNLGKFSIALSIQRSRQSKISDLKLILPAFQFPV